MKKLALALITAGVAGCLPTADVVPRYAVFDVEGEAGISAFGNVQEADLGEAGLEADNSVFGARADLKWGSPHVVINVQDSTHGGDGTLDATISGDGQVFNAGTDIESELDLGVYSGIVTFDVLPTEMFELGFGVGLNVLDVDSSFTEDATGESIETDQAVPLPVLAVQGGVQWGDLEAAAVFSGSGVSYDGDSISYYDLDVFGRWGFLGDTGSLILGYRYLDIGLDYDDGGDEVDANVTFDGPYIGLQISM